jgi:hypothetical protein
MNNNSWLAYCINQLCDNLLTKLWTYTTTSLPLQNTSVICRLTGCQVVELEIPWDEDAK